MLRKAKLSLFTDMVFTALIIIVLLIGMLVIFSAKKNIERKAYQDSIDWEADYLALAVMRLPVSSDVLLGDYLSRTGALSDDDKKMLDSWMDDVIIPSLKDGKPKKNSFDSVALLIIIDDNIVYCSIKRNTVSDFSPCPGKSISFTSNFLGGYDNDLLKSGFTQKSFLEHIRSEYDDLGARASYHTLVAEHIVSSVVVVQ